MLPFETDHSCEVAVCYQIEMTKQPLRKLTEANM